MRSDIKEYVRNDLSREELDYIISTRSSLRNLGWGFWVALGVVSVLFWDSIGLNGFFLILISAVAIGGFISFAVSRRIKERTGLESDEQVYAWRRYKHHGYEFFSYGTGSDESKRSRSPSEEKEASNVYEKAGHRETNNTDYFYSDGEEKYGPFSKPEIEKKIESGNIKPEFWIWHEGMSEWKPAQEVLDLRDKPPPLPSKKSSPAEQSENNSDHSPPSFFRRLGTGIANLLVLGIGGYAGLFVLIGTYQFFWPPISELSPESQNLFNTFYRGYVTAWGISTILSFFTAFSGFSAFGTIMSWFSSDS